MKVLAPLLMSGVEFGTDVFEFDVKPFVFGLNGVDTLQRPR